MKCRSFSQWPSLNQTFPIFDFLCIIFTRNQMIFMGFSFDVITWKLSEICFYWILSMIYNIYVVTCWKSSTSTRVRSLKKYEIKQGPVSTVALTQRESLPMNCEMIDISMLVNLIEAFALVSIKSWDTQSEACDRAGNDVLQIPFPNEFLFPAF